MSDTKTVEELLATLESADKGVYSLRYYSGATYLEYYSSREGDCIYFEFDKDGKLLDISA